MGGIKTVAVVVLLLVGGASCAGCLISGAQRKMIFPAGGMVWCTPRDEPFGWEYEAVSVPVRGKVTTGWFIPAPERRGTVLFSHGNAGTMAGRLESAAVFRQLGFDVLLYDYGGYGNSTGKASEKRCYDDIRAMWEHLTQGRGIPGNEIVLFGRSLGGGPTTQLATEVEARCVILESTFVSVPKLADELLKPLPVSSLIMHDFDNGKKIGEVFCPVLVVHSPGDDIVPYHHGEELFRLAKEPKSWLEIRGQHNSGVSITGEAYVRGMAAFLDPLFPREL